MGPSHGYRPAGLRDARGDFEAESAAYQGDHPLQSGDRRGRHQLYRLQGGYQHPGSRGRADQGHRQRTAGKRHFLHHAAHRGKSASDLLLGRAQHPGGYAKADYFQSLRVLRHHRGGYQEQKEEPGNRVPPPDCHVSAQEHDRTDLPEHRRTAGRHQPHHRGLRRQENHRGHGRQHRAGQHHRRHHSED